MMVDRVDDHDESVDELIARDFGPQGNSPADDDAGEHAPASNVVGGDKASGDAFAERRGWSDVLQDNAIAADFGADPDEA